VLGVEGEEAGEHAYALPEVAVGPEREGFAWTRSEELHKNKKVVDGALDAART
jgi:hypothetical protein